MHLFMHHGHGENHKCRANRENPHGPH
ncbi:hypothetical protein [Azotobacter armeniacus]